MTPSWAGMPARPLVMGIVNVTPDSFSDPAGRDAAAAIALGKAMIADGADLIDIGGESTRPGAAPVAPEAEQARVLPVLARLAGAGVPLSIDTRNAATMRAALAAGATIVNDVSGLTHDPAAATVVAASGCRLVLMHMRGTPATMSGLARYDDPVRDVVGELGERLDAALSGGLAPPPAGVGHRHAIGQ